jgi:hypothetical protein
MKHYVMLESIDGDEFYDVAWFRVGEMDDQTGVLLSLPIPQSLNIEWVDNLISTELYKLLEYIDGKKTSEETEEKSSKSSTPQFKR